MATGPVVHPAAEHGGRGTADGGTFGDRLVSRVTERRSQIVLGIDPDPSRLWPRAVESVAERDAPVAVRAGEAVAAHCRLLLEAAGEQCVAIKPQVACFERLGPPGWAALADVVAEAHERGLLVIADAKRGDIDISARAYGQAFFGATSTPFGEVAGLGADALTASPLLGRDSLAPLVEAARAACGGLFVLTRTSNPGAAEIQDRALDTGEPVSDLIAGIVDELGAPGIGSGGLSDIGAVAGATVPEHLARLRARMPAAPILLPGVGAQGAGGDGLAPAFAPGPAGGLVASSRSIVYAHEQRGGDPGDAARDEARRLRELIWERYSAGA